MAIDAGISKILDWVKLPTKTLIGLCIVFGVLIFSSDELLERFGMIMLVTEYRSYFGLGFLGTFAISTVNALAQLWKFTKPWRVKWFVARNGRTYMKTLSPEE